MCLSKTVSTPRALLEQVYIKIVSGRQGCIRRGCRMCRTPFKPRRTGALGGTHSSFQPFQLFHIGFELGIVCREGSAEELHLLKHTATVASRSQRYKNRLSD